MEGIILVTQFFSLIFFFPPSFSAGYLPVRIEPSISWVVQKRPDFQRESVTPIFHFPCGRASPPAGVESRAGMFWSLARQTEPGNEQRSICSQAQPLKWLREINKHANSGLKLLPKVSLVIHLSASCHRGLSVSNRAGLRRPRGWGGAACGHFF